MLQKVVAGLMFFVTFSSWAMSTGSGFFVSSQGHIITNAHVIEGAVEVAVRMKNGASHAAKVISVDKSNDLALLKVDVQSKPLHLRSVDGVEKGAKVYTLGFPNPTLQGFEAKYTDGVISSFSGLADAPNIMQVTVPIQPGNSGGPLIDDKGNVIGIVVAKLNALAVLKSQAYIPENVNYAIKSDYALPLLLGIPTAQRAARRTANSASEIEASVVLILAMSPEDQAGVSGKPKKAEAPAAPPQVAKESPRRIVTVNAPDMAENGCVVPVGFTVVPSLQAGERATFTIDGQPSFGISVTEGSLKEFGFRLRLNGNSSLGIDCKDCVTERKPIKVGLACSDVQTPSDIGRVQVRVDGSMFRSLIEGNLLSGELQIQGVDFGVRVGLSPATARNPFVLLKSDEELRGRLCIRVRTAYASEQACN